MGWNPIKKVTNTVNSIASNPLDPKNYLNLGLQTVTGGQVDLDGVNGLGSFNDILLGKKAKDIEPDQVANMIRATQMKGISELNSALDTPSENIVKEGAERAKKSLLTSAQDARRNAQKLMAQRGLGNTSLGLAVNRTIDQNLGRDISSINAQLPGQIRNQKIYDATTRIGVGGINQGGINFNKIEGVRSGGVLGTLSAFAPVIGTAAGAYFGGPMGAMAGSQAGQGMATAYNRPKNNYGNYA